MSTYHSTTIPEELQYFDVQAQHGELTAKVGVAEVLALVDWLVAKGFVGERFKDDLLAEVAHG
jgi:hypothetical protein